MWNSSITVVSFSYSKKLIVHNQQQLERFELLSCR